MDLHSQATEQLNQMIDRMYILVENGTDGISDAEAIYKEYKEWFSENEILIMHIEKIQQ